MAEYVATKTLLVGFAAAHQPGDLVPEANIKRNGWEDGVAKVGTKAAQAVMQDPSSAEATGGGGGTDADVDTGPSSTAEPVRNK
jgi:hypothetical protein